MPWTWRRATSPWVPGTVAGPQTGGKKRGMRMTLKSLVAWGSQPNPQPAINSHHLLLLKSPTGAAVYIFSHNCVVWFWY